VLPEKQTICRWDIKTTKEFSNEQENVFGIGFARGVHEYGDDDGMQQNGQRIEGSKFW
jgi:hypothetical protein